MRLAMIGLGKMGANMATRLMKGGHEVVAFDLNADAIRTAEADGAIGAQNLADLASKLSSPRVAWIMVPAGAPTEKTVASIAELFAPGDIVIDGGNSNYKDTLRRAAELQAMGIHLVDVGTSGGVWGLKEGYSMMVGGEEEAVESITSALKTLAPGDDLGWGRVGPAGAGHFVKMVHNGIEYGMMQAYAEGFAIMERKKEFSLDLQSIAEIWRHGSVVRSWLLDLTADALDENPDLDGIAPFVPDSGEGRWTVNEAIDLDVSAPVITLALLNRLSSREKDSFGDKLLSAMRNQFGGHSVKKSK
ncbi:MAG: decarboxylating 6-phosphogluconate dehydrogenase [Rhodothermales bacterium]|nr:decarboxylating 6-phosphogluconate dehydrogenase [Rhodothermales bacterium]